MIFAWIKIIKIRVKKKSCAIVYPVRHRKQQYKSSQSLLQLLKRFMISALPHRNRGNHLDRCATTCLSTNLFKVDFRQDTKIFIYAAKTAPDISQENVKKFRSILMHSRKIIERMIGTYAICGRTLFGSKSNGGKDELGFKVEFEGSPYHIFLKMVKQIAMSDIHSQDKRKSGVVFCFLNNVLRNFFHELDYSEIGKSRKYFDSQHYQQLESAKVLIYKGYSSNFTLLEGGLFLRMDPAVKIVRSETALDVINRIYTLNSSLSKQEKRLAVEQQLVGKMVMANYGKNAYHVIESLVFDVLIDAYTFFNGKETVNLIQYYKEAYGIQITSKRQPLIKAEVDRKSKDNRKEIILIPELLLMSGLPEDIDQRKRKQISQQTIVPPSQKLGQIESIFARFNSDKDSFNPDVVADKLGIKLDTKPAKINAKQLQAPELQLGRKQRIQEHKSTNFALFNKPLFNSSVALRIAVIYPNNYDLGQAKQLLRSTCANLGLQHKINAFPIKFQETRSTLKTIEDTVYKECESGSSKDTTNIFWLILPNSFKSSYSAIKKMILRNGIERNSQVSLTSTMQNKNFNSIVTKILLQMAAKVGNKLWVPKISSKLTGSGVMMIGIQNYGDTANRSMNVLSYCSNSNKQFSSFYSNYILHSKEGNAKTHMNQIIINCISEYIRTTKSAPTDMIIIKNGSSKYDNKLMVDTEVSEIKKTLETISGHQKVNLAYIFLDKDTNQKFFAERGKDVVNPHSGMLVNSQAVGSGFEFYLVAQQCNRGTVRPTFYKVAYCDSSLEEGLIEELMFSQCFNYMNWSGAIKVPAVLQYAKKLSMFVAQYLSEKCVGQSLSKHLYYI